MSDVRNAVRERYGQIAAERGGTSCCTTKCGSGKPDEQAKKLGYSEEEIAAVPDGANLGLGRGNPHVMAAAKPGETVVDLGSGAGIDCFVVAQQVGETGKVIGVDMTPEMVSLARENAEKAGVKNVEFRLGEIEHLPVADGSVDVILSNCVINLSPNKAAVYREAFRVLRRGGRLAISDIVATAELPEDVRNDLDAYVGCMAGASEISALEASLAEIGFTQISIRPLDESRELIREWAPDRGLQDYVLSATIEAIRPKP